MRYGATRPIKREQPPAKCRGYFSSHTKGGILVAKTLDELLAELQQPTFEARTDEQLQQAASNKFGSYYDQLALGKKQSYEQTKTNLQNQLAALLPTYQKQAEQAQKATAQTRSVADRTALSRGLNRSSYNTATLANIDLEGNKTQNDINTALTQAQGAIQSQDTLAANQLAQMLEEYNRGRATDMGAYIEEQRQSDYDKGAQSSQYRNSLLLELAKLDEEQRQFNTLHPATSAASASNTKIIQPPPAPGAASTDDRFLASLLGFGGTNAGVAAMRTLLKNPKYKPAAQNTTGKGGYQD
jgi:hypothetical protein